MKKVKTILVSQPRPDGDKSPLIDIAKKLNCKIDFRPFIQIEPVSVREFRNQRAPLSDFTAIIFNSKNAIDTYFAIATEMRTAIPEDMKYFCINEQAANYMQKHLQVRKRKLFHGEGTEASLMSLLKKHNTEKYFFPCSDIRKDDIPDFLTKQKIFFKEGMIYRTVSADLSDLANVYYDIIVFYSPADIKSLYDNFPDYEQNDTRIAAWGKTTIKAVEDANLTVNIAAPTPECPSMGLALEKYIILASKG